MEQHLSSFLVCTDAVQLFMAIVDFLQQEYETPDTRGTLSKVLTLAAQLAARVLFLFLFFIFALFMYRCTCFYYFYFYFI